MNWFSLLKKAKPLDDILDKDNGLIVKAGQFIDEFAYTDEERSERRAEVIASFNDFVKSTLNESTERSMTRRNIAELWVKFELGLVGLCAVCAPLNMDIAKFYWKIATSDLMFWGTLSILAFFYGVHMLRDNKVSDVLSRKK